MTEPIDPRKRALLTSQLSALSQEIARDLQAKILDPAPSNPSHAAARALHREERVGVTFEVWSDLLSRRAAVLWVLKSVYVRVLEDRGLASPKRIIDPESQELFGKLAPNLGDTSYLRWVYRDLASPESGLGELFVPQPAEVAWPSDAMSRKLLDFWRQRDADTGRLRYELAGERFDGRLMGDLYQDLDPVVKDRYALLQTPDFVLDFILDETLTPAIAEFGIETVRVIDPACGSGHFLLGAFRRLVAGLCDNAQREKPTRDMVVDALSRVVGIDLNDYACALARARLVMAAAEMIEGGDLATTARDLHPQVYLADALDQLEDVQTDLFAATPGAAVLAGLTHPETRARLRRVLEPGFHAVVANPPYITEKDDKKKEYHRGKVGREPRYKSAFRQYSLASPFTERAFQLAVPSGYVGLITSNNFMKREFGKTLVEDVLARHKMTKVVDTSGAYIPGHGTPTVLLFARRLAPGPDAIHAIMGKRGEPGTPEDASRGLVWQSIVDANANPSFENEFVSASTSAREFFAAHPWSLRGGGAADVKEQIEAASIRRLDDMVAAIGRTTHTGLDPVYYLPPHVSRRIAPADRVVILVKGEDVRDYSISANEHSLFPYDSSTIEAVAPSSLTERAFYWRFRAALKERRDFGQLVEERGLKWFEHTMFFADRYRTPLSIAFAFVATHNHFVLDRGGKVFNRSAPVIKLPATATEDDHLALLGLLNSSTACFWMKQVFHCKGGQGINEGAKSELWEQFYEFDSTKLRAFPIVQGVDVALVRHADALAQSRNANSIAKALGRSDWSTTAALRVTLEARRTTDFDLLLRLVAAQEELDWSVYRAFGLDAPAEPPRSIADIVPTLPTARAMDIALGSSDDEEPATAWFTRHGWQPQSLDDVPARCRDIVRARIAATQTSKTLELLETPMYKRRWYKPDYEAEEQAALEDWLLDRLERWSEARTTPFTAEDAATGLQHDAQLLAVLEVRTNRRDFDMATELGVRLQQQSVPNQKHHRYKPSGLAKRQAWEHTWELQHREDAGEAVTPPVPPKYVGADFLKPEYYQHRGPLDVPKERWLALTEVPPDHAPSPLYLWAGHSPRQRAKALLELDETLSEAAVPTPDRHGLLHSIWTLLPYVAWESPETAAELRSVIQMEVGKDGITDHMLHAWSLRFPPLRGSRQGSRRATSRKSAGESDVG